MSLSFEMLLEFSSSLALVAILAAAFGAIDRKLGFDRRAKLVLGSMFGAVACLQMNLPITPMEGVILDLRCVPVVLAGAFLGWRGALVCLAIAVAARVQVGGVGMWTGIAAMVVSSAVGLVWARVWPKASGRSTLAIAVLGIASSLNMASVFFLPDPAFTWVVENTLAAIFIMNFLSVFLVGMLIQSEIRRMEVEARLGRAAIVHPETGVMTRGAFERELELRARSEGVQAPVALVRVRIRHYQLLTALVPKNWRPRLLGMVHERIRDVLPEGTLAFGSDDATLMIALTYDQMRRNPEINRRIERIAGGAAFILPSDLRKRITVDADILPWKTGKTLTQAMSGKIRFALPVLAKAMQAQGGAAPVSRKPRSGATAVPHGATLDALFGKASMMMPLSK